MRNLKPGRNFFRSAYGYMVAEVCSIISQGATHQAQCRSFVLFLAVHEYAF
jgi:hypothetical protein